MANHRTDRIEKKTEEVKDRTGAHDAKLVIKYNMHNNIKFY